VTTVGSVFWRTGVHIVLRIMLGIVLLALLPYAWSPIYSFPDATPFAGPALWNPYESVTGTWQRANLHAHGRAWGGLTSGDQSDAEVARRYHQLGYSVAGVSDYQRIAAFGGVDTIPLYEHGFNAGKNHQLAIGAHGVDWVDFLLWQSLSNQQYVIDRVRRKADLVALNHPSSRDAYDAAATRALTGYQLIEVVNGPFSAEDVWDSALSSGRPVWALANDDTHDLSDVRRTAVGWNMIDSPSPSTADIISALRTGRSYAVLRTGAADAAGLTTLSSVAVHDGTIRVELEGALSTITFIGQDGTVRRTAKDASTAEYTMTDGDTYVRTVVTSPQTTLFLNPVIRWDGSTLPAPAARVDAAWTWTQRGGIAFGCVFLFLRVNSRRAETRVAARDALARRVVFKSSNR
jgi:hypothetical protein